MSKTRKQKRRKGRTPEWMKASQQIQKTCTAIRQQIEWDEEYEPCWVDYPSGLKLDINDETLGLCHPIISLRMSKHTFTEAVKHYLSIHDFGWTSFDYCMPYIPYASKEMKSQTYPRDMADSWQFPMLPQMIVGYLHETSSDIDEALRVWAHMIAASGKAMQRFAELRMGLPMGSLKRFPMDEFEVTFADVFQYLSFWLDEFANPGNEAFLDCVEDYVFYEG